MHWIRDGPIRKVLGTTSGTPAHWTPALQRIQIPDILNDLFVHVSDTDSFSYYRVCKERH
jgi:hypothetical protein